MNKSSFLHIHENGEKIPEHFPFLKDAPEEIQRRIQLHGDFLESSHFSDAICSEDPTVPESREEAEIFVERYIYNIKELCAIYPAVVYYRLTQVLYEVRKFEDFNMSPVYLGLMANWIHTASKSSDISSIHEMLPEIEEAIAQQSKCIYQSAETSLGKTRLSEDSIVRYRTHMLAVIKAVSRFCIQIGQHDNARKYIYKGIQISEQMYAGESVFDFFLLDLDNISSQKIAISLSSLQQIFWIARKGFERITRQQRDKYLSKRMKYQLGISELLLVTQKADLGNIKVIRGINRSCTSLCLDREVSDECRLQLAHIEILLYKAIQGILSYRIEEGQQTKDDLVFITGFGHRIIQEGFMIEKLLEKIDALALLPVLIDFFELRCLGSSKKGEESDEYGEAYEVMIEIFRMASGSIQADGNLEILLETVYFQKYITLAGTLLGSEKLSKKDVLGQLRGIVTEKDRQAQINQTQLLKSIKQKWKSLVKVTISDISSDSSYTLNESTRKTYTQEFEVPFNDIFFRVSLELNLPPLNERQLMGLKNDIARLIPYENQNLIKKRLESTSRTLKHDSVSTLGGIQMMAEVMGKTIKGARDEIRNILSISGNPPETVEKLQLLSEETIPTLGKIVTMLHAGTTRALRLAERIPYVVQRSLDGRNNGGSKKFSCEIGQLLQESLLLHGDNEHLSVSVDIPEMFSQFVLVDEVDFRRMIENFIQNAIRYRKINQEFAIVEISLEKQSSGELIISIQDYGQGMSEKDSETYKQAHKKIPDYEANAHGDSHHIGAESIMQIIESHGWKLGIESILGESVKFIITIPEENMIQEKR